jgi:hypothetical protein
MVVGVLFFVLPALLFFRLAGREESRVAAMILALTLPATGALVVRLNPDLVPDRASLRDLPPAEWAHVVLFGALLAAGAWWLAGLLAPR